MTLEKLGIQEHDFWMIWARVAPCTLLLAFAALGCNTEGGPQLPSLPWCLETAATLLTAAFTTW